MLDQRGATFLSKERRELNPRERKGHEVAMIGTLCESAARNAGLPPMLLRELLLRFFDEKRN